MAEGDRFVPFLGESGVWSVTDRGVIVATFGSGDDDQMHALEWARYMNEREHAVVVGVTPHDDDRAEAAEEIAEAAAEVAEEAAEEAVETATAVEEAVGAAEEAIPPDTPAEVEVGMMDALEMIADLAESEAETAVEAAAEAEVAAEVAEAAEESGDVEEAQRGAMIAEHAAEVATEAAADVAPRRHGFARWWWGDEG